MCRLIIGGRNYAKDYKLSDEQLNQFTIYRKAAMDDEDSKKIQALVIHN